MRSTDESLLDKAETLYEPDTARISPAPASDRALSTRARLSRAAWIVVIGGSMLAAGAAPTASGTARAVAARACARVSAAQVRSAFGGTVGPGHNHALAAGRAACVFTLSGRSHIDIAARKPSAGEVTVELTPLSARTARATIARFNAAEHTKPRPRACTSAWRKACPLPGIGQAAFFLSHAAGGGGSGLLTVLSGTSLLGLSSNLRVVHSHLLAAAPGRRAYAVNQADLIALGKRITARSATPIPLSSTRQAHTDLPSARAIFENPATNVRLLNSILVTWKTPAASAAHGSPTAYACYGGSSPGRLVFALAVRPHAALQCLFRRPAPGSHFFKVTVHFARGSSGSSRVLSVTVPTVPPAISGLSVDVTSATGASDAGGTFTYQLAWSAPSAPNGDPATYYTYDVFVETSAGSSGSPSQAAVTPILVGETPSTDYTYTVPYQPGVRDRLFEIGAVHDGVVGPLASASS